MMAKKGEPDGTSRLNMEPVTMTTYLLNSKTASKEEKGHQTPPKPIVKDEGSEEESDEDAEREGTKRRRLMERRFSQLLF
jgi:hypothetical protein